MSQRLTIEQNSAFFSFPTEIEGTLFTLTFRWNDRDGGWFLDVADGELTPLLSGIRVVINTMLLGRATASGLPSGDFIAFDTAGNNDDAGYEDLGRRVQINYFTKAEFDAAGIPTVLRQ